MSEHPIFSIAAGRRRYQEAEAERRRVVLAAEREQTEAARMLSLASRTHHEARNRARSAVEAHNDALAVHDAALAAADRSRARHEALEPSWRAARDAFAAIDAEYLKACQAAVDAGNLSLATRRKLEDAEARTMKALMDLADAAELRRVALSDHAATVAALHQVGGTL